jgi:acetylornithine deacetylase
MERRTLPAERTGIAGDEVDTILSRLRAADPEFRAAHRVLFARSPYEIPADHALPVAMLRARASAEPVEPVEPAEPVEPVIGMSFWTDAAILGGAGIPSILFGPTGAGLHSVEEWVDVKSVLTCRDALVALTRDWCR